MPVLKVCVLAPDTTVRTGVLTTLRRAGVALADEPERCPDTVIVAAADTVDEAIEACPPRWRTGGQRMLVVAERFPPSGVRRAVRSGVGVLLRADDATPTRLVAALHSAQDGDGRLPHDVLIGVLGGGDDPVPQRPKSPAPRAPLRFPLTPRQTAVLKLMAEGQANAAIARSLSCSEHTVKNVIYELMARLQVRNRAHAVACAVREGLI